jgi:amidohydrolase
MTMLEQAQAIHNDIVRTRRDLHAHPELGFRETRTAGVVEAALKELGFADVRTGIGRTGVVAELGPDRGPTIGIRADMDALPIQEATPHEFRSQNDGVMHACGHDCHTSMLLGAARLLKNEFDANGSSWRGRIRLLFQPCEETFDANGVSGATAMIRDGALDGVDEVIALHIISDIPSGILQFCDGLAMAAVDSFEAVIHAGGGHGAYPHQSTDPLFMLATVLPNLYGIPSRKISPLKPCVVSLGEISGGSASNVIPNRVKLQGTIRSLEDSVREKLWSEVEKCFGLVEPLGGRCEFTLHKGYPSLCNNADVNKRLQRVAAEMVDGDCIVEEPFGMGAEDFAYMAREAPGAMFFLGAKVPGGGSHHTPVFDVDESVFPLGSAMLAETARRFVSQ